MSTYSVAAPAPRKGFFRTVLRIIFWVVLLLIVAGAMMYAPYGPFFAQITETVPRNVVGGAIALINSMGALGSFVGAYGVGMLNSVTGSPGASYLMMAAGLIVSALITIGLQKAGNATS